MAVATWAATWAASKQTCVQQGRWGRFQAALWNTTRRPATDPASSPEITICANRNPYTHYIRSCALIPCTTTRLVSCSISPRARNQIALAVRHKERKTRSHFQSNAGRTSLPRVLPPSRSMRRSCVAIERVPVRPATVRVAANLAAALDDGDVAASVPRASQLSARL